MRWRANDPAAVLPPEPWPARVDAFMVACAIHAADRERDLMSTVEGLLAATTKKGGKGRHR